MNVKLVKTIYVYNNVSKKVMKFLNKIFLSILSKKKK